MNRLRVALVLVVLAGLGSGLWVADVTSRPKRTETATAPGSTTTSTAAPETTPIDSVTTEPALPSTTASSPSTTPTSTMPTTTVSTFLTTTTRPPTTTAPPTTQPPPALISVSYLQDPSGRLVVPPGGSATLTLVNTGGQPGQWFLRVSSEFRLSATDGSLAPGERITITVSDLVRAPHSATITGFLAPTQRVAIPVVVLG